MTPGEFETYLAGCGEGLRDERLLFKGIESVLRCALGEPISPLALIGEEQEYGTPFTSTESEEALERSALRSAELLRREAEAELKHGAWLPEGIVVEP